MEFHAVAVQPDPWRLRLIALAYVCDNLITVVPRLRAIPW
jgi:hypothetical protein